MIFKRKTQQGETVQKVTPVVSLETSSQFTVETSNINKLEICDYNTMETIFKANIRQVDREIEFKFKIR